MPVDIKASTSANVAAKPTRADEVRQERRRKPGKTALSGIKLSVDEERLDRNTYQYRFVNDDANRIAQLTAQDWDIAPEGAKSDTNSLGTVSSATAGTTDAGKPYNAVLMRKRKDWFEEDQREKQRPLDEMDKAIRRGQTNHKANDNIDGAYTPGVNIIESA